MGNRCSSLSSSMLIDVHRQNRWTSTPKSAFPSIFSQASVSFTQVTYLGPHFPVASRSREPLLLARNRPSRIMTPWAPLNWEASDKKPVPWWLGKDLTFLTFGPNLAERSQDVPVFGASVVETCYWFAYPFGWFPMGDSSVPWWLVSGISVILQPQTVWLQWAMED